MPTLYALPTLTNWNAASTTGWSSSSGGPSAGLSPTADYDVVFDVNSGPARTITTTGTPQCRSITSVGANNLTLTGGVSVYHSLNATINFSGFSSSSTVALGLYPASGFSNFSANITGGNVTFTSLSNQSSNSDLTFLSDFKCNGPFTGALSTLNSNGFNLTFSAFLITQAYNLALSNSTITLTGSGSLWTVVPFQSTLTNTTFKITDTSSSTKILKMVEADTGSGGGLINVNNKPNLTIETGLGSGAVILQQPGSWSYYFTNVFCKFGSTLSLPAGKVVTIDNLTADGTGGMITLNSSTSGTAATLAKSGGGTVGVNYCNIKDITASPAATFTARNSKNISNNTGWTFIPPNDRFFQFL